MRDKQIRNSWITWSVATVVVVITAMLLSITLNRQWEQVFRLFGGGGQAQLPETSQYEMITYADSECTVDQTEFPFYYNEVTEEANIGTVSVTRGRVFGVEVDFQLGGREDSLPAMVVREWNTPYADGALDDHFTGIRESLQQMKEQGYTDYFVLHYKDGLFLLGGYKDGEIGLLPMWERAKGMEYYFSHFTEPMTVDQVEYCRALWDELYEIGPRVVEGISSPCMAFDDPPKETTLFSPIRGRDHVKPRSPDKDPRN